MNKTAELESIYNEAFDDELKKLSFYSVTDPKTGEHYDFGSQKDADDFKKKLKKKK